MLFFLFSFLLFDKRMRVGGSTLTKVCTLKEDKQKYSWNEEIDLAAYMGGKSSPKERERYSNFQK